jgi:hypothetical protein
MVIDKSTPFKFHTFLADRMPKLKLGNNCIAFMFGGIGNRKWFLNILGKLERGEGVKNFCSESVFVGRFSTLRVYKFKGNGIVSAKFVEENAFAFNPSPFGGDVSKKTFNEEKFLRLMKTKELSNMREVKIINIPVFVVDEGYNL